MSASLAVVTIVHGRHDHLRGQLAGLRGQTRAPDLLVVVAMDDPAVPEVVRAEVPTGWEVRHASTGRPQGRLPLAAARNLGVATAVAAGAEHLVLLDVDCVPADSLVARYGELLGSLNPDDGPTILCGDVAYEVDPAEGPRPPRYHPARPRLDPPEVRVVDDVNLFWSLSFAVTASDLAALGGFDEGYVGYGAEDTDVGQRLARAGGRLLFVGGAGAVHQWHPSPNPPVQHVDDIVANANRFAEVWGWWPMTGWLEQFDGLGLVRRRPDGRWVTTP
ncbi:galactosyltransferase-related protein [Arthrobacter sp. NEB 688]|uniref:glycosyltransferase family 2 protein n=1 Tax=Arthrobacter sp. NEB 688 TaxID=904039 RepID=UPI001567BFD7|nr:galactosyltransferase-related protein [Arthrobacter sp. NEB 688]QKE82543.1 glycosyltransferase family 2 protein [Arthrobacter sp. NEB 688]